MKNFLKRNILYILLIVFLVGYYFYNVRVTEQKLAELRMRESVLLEQISDLKIQIEMLEDYRAMSQTPEFIERLAREKLKMVKPDEIIYYIDSKGAE